MWFRRSSSFEPGDMPQRLRQAAAWCERVVGKGQAPRLWSKELCDIDRDDEDALWKALEADPAGTVASVVTRRADALGNDVANTVRGRVLICEYDVTLFEGATQAASEGLVDLWDVPAWDLWIGLLPAESLRLGGKNRPDPLVSWIPDALVMRADAAVESSSTEVFSWLDRRDAKLARALVQA